MISGGPRPESLHVVVLGGGTIGTGLASVFVNAGFVVDLVEPEMDRRLSVQNRVVEQFADMEIAGYSRESRTVGLKGLRAIERLEAARAGPDILVEAGPESLQTKMELFRIARQWVGEGTPVATTSSSLPISAIVTNPDSRRWCLAAHCINPPSIIRAIECAPSPETCGEAMEMAVRVFELAGFHPVRLNREIPALVLNRLQAAVLREAYRLVDDGIVGVDGLDTLVREGLGPRWAITGPFETADLNTTGGIAAHAELLGPTYRAIGECIGERNSGWSEPLVAKVAGQRRAILPEPHLPARRAWRRRTLARLESVRKSLLEEWEPPRDE